MKESGLKDVPLSDVSLSEALASLNCTFDLQWKNLLMQGEELEVSNEHWVTTALSSELHRGVSLQQILVLSRDEAIISFSGNAYPSPADFGRVGRIFTVIIRMMLRMESKLAQFFTIFPNEDRRHYQLRNGTITPFETINCDGESSRIRAYLLDGDGKLLIGAHKGLFQVDPETQASCALLRIPEINWITVGLHKSLYLGTATHGVFKSEDRGKTWSKLTNLPVDNVITLSVDETKKVMYLNTKHGVFVSTNDGASWRSMPEEFLSGGVREFVVDGVTHIAFVKTNDHRLFMRVLD